MSPLPPLLLTASAAIILTLGVIHLIYTFIGVRLHPKDVGLREELTRASLVITEETTIWKAWIGFNASHSYGAILFGALYGYPALFHSVFLFRSLYLLLLGLSFLLGYTVLGTLYWFRVPLWGIYLATALYAGALLFAIA